MTSPGFLVTPAGAAAFAASEAAHPVAISHLAFGDANGVAYVPTGAETALRHELTRIPVSQVVRDPVNANQLIATATVPEALGGFQILEVAVYLQTGELAAVGPANLYKSTPADGVVTSLTVDAVFAVSPAASVVVALNDAALVTQAFVLQHRQFFAVVSATTPTPPAQPGQEDQYLLPAACTGVWAGHDAQVAIWRGAADGWLFVSTPFGSQCNAADTNRSWLLTSSGWVQKAGGFGAESTKASADTCDLGSAATHLVRITGSAAISSFGASADLNAPLYVCRLTGAAVLVNGPGLLLPGGGDIAGAPGDVFMAQFLGGGWRVDFHQPAAGYDRLGAAAAAQAAAQATAKAYADSLAAVLAPLLSPTFIGTPKAPTAGPGTNTTQLATTAFVTAAIAALIGAAPAILDTLGEIAAQLQNDESVASALATTVAGKISRSGDTMTGALGLPAPPPFTRDGRAARMADVCTGGAFAGVSVFSNATVLPASACGRLNLINGSGIALTLPPAAAVPEGVACALASIVSVATGALRQGGDVLYIDGVVQASYTLGPFGKAVFVSDGAGAWQMASEGNLHTPNFRGAPTAAMTPERTAADQRLTPAGWVKSVGRRFSAQRGLNAARALTADDCGAPVVALAAGAYTLPSAGLISGDTVSLQAAVSGVTLATAAGSQVYNQASGLVATPLAIPRGWWIEAYFDGGVSWIVRSLSPSQGGSGLVLVQTQTVTSAVSAVDFTVPTGLYDRVRLEWTGAVATGGPSGSNGQVEVTWKDASGAYSTAGFTNGEGNEGAIEFANVAGARGLASGGPTPTLSSPSRSIVLYSNVVAHDGGLAGLRIRGTTTNTPTPMITAGAFKFLAG